MNAVGPANLARACQATGTRLLQVSTDYVFSGDATSTYAEDGPRAPVSAYGQSKSAGESAVHAYCPDSWIVRTAWLYGSHGGNFVRTMARLAEASSDPVRVVHDQRGQPTCMVDLAEFIFRLVDADAPRGIYHGTSSGETTWWGLARAVFELLSHDPERVATTTSDAFVRPAPRPAYSVLGPDAWNRASLKATRRWRNMLESNLHQVAGPPHV